MSENYKNKPADNTSEDKPISEAQQAIINQLINIRDPWIYTRGNQQKPLVSEERKKEENEAA